MPSRYWDDTALQALPWSVRARLQRHIGAGAASVLVDAELLHATLRYVPNAELRRQVSASAGWHPWCALHVLSSTSLS